MSRFHNLGQRLSEPLADEPDTSGNEPDEPETTTSKSKKKDPVMTEQTDQAAIDAAKKEGHEAGFKAANDRMNKVFASEYYAGREAAAAKLLGKPAMSAEDIIDVLADMPKVETAALTEEEQRQAAEEGGRKEMQAALGQQQNSNIDAGGGNGGGEQDKAAAASSAWDKAYARTFPNQNK